MRNLAPTDETKDIPRWDQTYQTFTLNVPGTLSATTAPSRLYVLRSGHIMDVTVAVASPPVTSAAVFNISINSGGAFVYVVGKPTIPVGGLADYSTPPSSPYFVGGGSTLQVLVEAANSAADLTMQILFRRS